MRETCLAVQRRSVFKRSVGILTNLSCVSRYPAITVMFKARDWRLNLPIEADRWGDHAKYNFARETCRNIQVRVEVVLASLDNSVDQHDER